MKFTESFIKSPDVISQCYKNVNFILASIFLFLFFYFWKPISFLSGILNFLKSFPPFLMSLFCQSIFCLSSIISFPSSVPRFPLCLIHSPAPVFPSFSFCPSCRPFLLFHISFIFLFLASSLSFPPCSFYLSAFNILHICRSI